MGKVEEDIMKRANIIKLDEIQERLNKEIEKGANLLDPQIIELSQSLDQHILDFYAISMNTSIK